MLNKLSCVYLHMSNLKQGNMLVRNEGYKRVVETILEADDFKALFENINLMISEAKNEISVTEKNDIAKELKLQFFLETAFQNLASDIMMQRNLESSRIESLLKDIKRLNTKI